MKATRTMHYRAVSRILSDRGIGFRVERGKRHPSVVFEHGGRAHRVVMPGSPSDRRGHLNAASHLKRLLAGGSEATLRR